MDDRRSIVLYPLSLLYGSLTSFRNFLFNSGLIRSFDFDVPVICIGNLAVGGTGKTPHAEYLINLLGKEFRIALLSRGYKRKSSGFILASGELLYDDLGDEPLQIFRKFPGVTVAVDGNRVRGVKKLLIEKPDLQAIILDDGFQHRRIRPGFSILLTDYSRLITRDAMLPYGNLREDARNMKRADVIIVTKSPADLPAIQRRLIAKELNKAPYQNIYFTTTTYLDPVPVFEAEASRTLKLEPGNTRASTLLVTGISRPEPLYDYLKNRFSQVRHLRFGDHHRFTSEDIEKICEAWHGLETGPRYLLTTEKDAVRLREFTNIAEPVRSSAFYIPVGTAFLNDDQAEFDNLIIDYVRKNKRINRIS